jgi:hypothetical protein
LTRRLRSSAQLGQHSVLWPVGERPGMSSGTSLRAGVQFAGESAPEFRVSAEGSGRPRRTMAR